MRPSAIWTTNRTMRLEKTLRATTKGDRRALKGNVAGYKFQ
jgi:hypothetical protein